MERNEEGGGRREKWQRAQTKATKTISNSHESWLVLTKKMSSVQCACTCHVCTTHLRHIHKLQGTGLYSVLPANLAEIAMLCAG